MNSADGNKDEPGATSGSATPAASSSQPARIRTRFPRAMPNVAVAGRSVIPPPSAPTPNPTETTQVAKETVTTATSELSIDTSSLPNRPEDVTSNVSPSKSNHTQMMAAPESPSKKHISFAIGLNFQIIVKNHIPELVNKTTNYF
jgi:hypothetical protein